MNHWKFSRRQMLKGMAVSSAGLYLPFLESLVPKAYAATLAAPPLRVVFIGNQNGQKTGNFFPPNPGAMTQFQPNVLYKRLSDISGPISPIFGTSWDGLRSKFSLLGGLDNITNEDTGHQFTTMLGCAPSPYGAGGGIPPVVPWAASADWIISQSPNFYKTAPLIEALRYDPYDFKTSFSNINGKPTLLSYLGTDQGLFNQAFASFGGTTLGSNNAMKRTIAAEQAIAQLAALQSSSRFSSTDKLRLKEHTNTMNKLKATYVNPVVPGVCNKPPITYYKAGDKVSKQYSNVNDIIVAAFACDVTRIACYNLNDFDDTNVDYVYQHNGVSHENGDAAMKASATISAWKAERIKDLITKLESRLDSDGVSTLFDNTLIMWSNESGETGIPHCCENIPLFIAGGKNISAKLKMGYYVDYRTTPFKYYAGRGDFAAAGRPINQFLASLMLSFGLTRTEFGKWGKKAGKFGDFSPRMQYYNNEYQLYPNNYDDNLPFIYTG